MTLREPKPGSFDHALTEVRIPVDSLLRLSRFAANEPYWSRGRYRFDGPVGGPFGTCYAADSLETAFCESVIHESSYFDGTRFIVSQSNVRERRIVRLQRPAAPVLRLVNFTGEALKKIALNNDLSAGNDYAPPQSWALAVFQHDKKWDGILYAGLDRPPRRYGMDCCLSLASPPGAACEKHVNRV